VGTAADVRRFDLGVCCAIWRWALSRVNTTLSESHFARAFDLNTSPHVLEQVDGRLVVSSGRAKMAPFAIEPGGHPSTSWPDFCN
jgi:hypothetical protein